MANQRFVIKKHKEKDWVILFETSIRTTNEYKDKVNLCYQFYIDQKTERQKEIRECLSKNVLNPYIDKIYLLNERFYSSEELGIESKKITQIVLNKRLTYKDIFDAVDEQKIKGYILCGNADIFFDASLKNIVNTELSLKPSMMSQIRFERMTPRQIQVAYLTYNDLVNRGVIDPSCPDKMIKLPSFAVELLRAPACGKYRLVGTFMQHWTKGGWRDVNGVAIGGLVPSEHAYVASSDIWIFHSNFNVKKIHREEFNFKLGIPGCDTYFAYMMWKKSFLLTKDPYFIKIFHHHESNMQNHCTVGAGAVLKARHQLGILPYDVTTFKSCRGIMPQEDYTATEEEAGDL